LRIAPPGQARPLAVGTGFVKRGLLARAAFGTAWGMTQSVPPPGTAKKDVRQARLAEQLRANLHRRKAQARALAATGSEDESPKTDLSKS
jgi:hypothetical protein